MKKRLILISILCLIISNNCFAETVEKSYEVIEVENNKLVSIDTLSKLFSKADYDIYLNDRKLSEYILSKEKNLNKTYHYIGYTEDNKHFFEDYSLDRPVQETKSQIQETTKKVEETTQKIEKIEPETIKEVNETTKKKIEEKKETTIAKVEETETKKIKEETKATNKINEVIIKPTSNNSNSQPSSFNNQDSQIVQEEITKKLSFEQWKKEYIGKIFSLRQFTRKVKELNEPTLIYLTSSIQREPIELNSSTLTEDQLFDIARKEGKMNIKIPFTNSTDDDFIYIILTEYSSPN